MGVPLRPPLPPAARQALRDAADIRGRGHRARGDRRVGAAREGAQRSTRTGHGGAQATPRVGPGGRPGIRRRRQGTRPPKSQIRERNASATRDVLQSRRRRRGRDGIAFRYDGRQPPDAKKDRRVRQKPVGVTAADLDGTESGRVRPRSRTRTRTKREKTKRTRAARRRVPIPRRGAHRGTVLQRQRLGHHREGVQVFVNHRTGTDLDPINRVRPRVR